MRLNDFKIICVTGKLINYIDLNDIFVYSVYILSYKQTNMVHFPKLKRAGTLMNFVGKMLLLVLL